MEEDSIGVEEVDALLRNTPLLHRTHFAFLNGVEVREGGREEGRGGLARGAQTLTFWGVGRGKEEEK